MRVSGIFRAAKSLAKNLNIPVMLLSQLSRDVDKTETKLPALRHLRYGGGAEATADYVMFCMPPDETVITQRGELPIVEVRVGDKVFTHRQRWQPVTEVMNRSYVGDLVGLRPVYSQKPVWLTPEHPVLISPDGKTVCWHMAGDLKEGDMVAMPDHTGLSSGYALVPLRPVERKWYVGLVHNMSVEGDQSYCSRLLALHNCYDPWRYAEMGEKIEPAQGTALKEDVWFLLIEKARYGRPGIVTFEFDRPSLVLRDRNVTIGKIMSTADEDF